ncbi:hypothetical protein GCM10010240_61530 [Streptomyces griseoviridis]|nr:hypothetical protein GCM10010240_61530 [Streptomyces griseoviridis]
MRLVGVDAAHAGQPGQHLLAQDRWDRHRVAPQWGAHAVGDGETVRCPRRTQSALEADQRVQAEYPSA